MSSSWEAASCIVTQEFPNILWNRKVHYPAHNNTLMVLTLSQITPFYTTSFYLRSILILSTHLRLCLPSSLLPSSFPTKFLYEFLAIHLCYMPFPSRPPLLDHSNYTWRRVQVMNLLIMQFSPTSCHFISLRSEYSPQHPVLKRTQSVFEYKTLSHKM
jgi:hypothetical protein